MDITTISQAMTATVGSGSIISQQTSFVGELKSKIEEMILASESIKDTIEGEVSVQRMIGEYFEHLSGFLAQNEKSHEAEDAIKEKSDELIEGTQTINSDLEAFISHITAAIELLDTVHGACGSAVDKANDVAGMISNIATS